MRFHTLDGMSDPRDVRRLSDALREPGPHVLVLDERTALPVDADVVAFAGVVRDSAVVTCAASRVDGAALLAFAAGSLRVGVRGAQFSWGAEPIVPGLAAVLSAACPRARSRLLWGEELHAEDADGLVHRVVDDPASIARVLAADLGRSGGTSGLSLRVRAVIAARELGSWESAAAFDKHLRAASAEA